MSIKSLSKDKKRQKHGLEPISKSKVIVKGALCREAFELLLQRIYDHKPGGSPPEWTDYPRPRVGMSSEEFEVGNGCCSSMLLCRSMRRL